MKGKLESSFNILEFDKLKEEINLIEKKKNEMILN